MALYLRNSLTGKVIIMVYGTSFLDAEDDITGEETLAQLLKDSIRRTRNRWAVVKELQPEVLTGTAEDWVSWEEFIAESEDEQERYKRWLQAEWADVKKELACDVIRTETNRRVRVRKGRDHG